MASAILPAGQVHAPTGGKSIQTLTAAGLHVEGEDGSESGSDSEGGRDSYSGRHDDREADELARVLHKHKDDGRLTKVFKKHPMILAHALRSLDEDDNVLYKFLDKHRHVVGKFLNQHQNIEVLAEFLAKYPAAMHQILDDEPSIVENFLEKEPEALYVYLNAKGDILRDYLAANPERFHTYMSRNPSLLSEFCDSHPAFMTGWLKNRQAMVHEYLLANPALFWNHVAAHPACTSTGQTLTGRKFTASLCHDIPQDQEHLVRLPITWSLPKNKEARQVALTSLGEHEDSEVSVQGMCKAFDAWANQETTVEEEELQRLTQEDHEWLNDHPTAKVPRPLEWCTGGKLTVQDHKKDKPTEADILRSAYARVFGEAQPSRRQHMNTRGGRNQNVLNTRGAQPQNAIYKHINTNTPPPASDFSNFPEDDDNILQSIEMSDNEVAPPRGSIKTIPGGKGKGKTIFGGKTTAMTGRKIIKKNNTRSTRNRACKDNNTKKTNCDISSDDDDDQSIKPSKPAAKQFHSTRNARPIKPVFNTQTKKQGKQRATHSQDYNESEDDGDFYIKEEEEDTQEEDSPEDDDSSDSDDYDAGKGSQKRKKNGRSARHQVNNNTTTTNVTSSSSSVSTSTSGRLLVPYPAPAAVLAADRMKHRGAREWSLREEDCGIRHMLAIRDADVFKGEHRFQEAARRMNRDLGTSRTKVSFKNFWNRCGRMRSGFDERRRQQAPLATSLQGKNTLPSNVIPRNAPAAKNALRKKTTTKANAVAAPAPNTTGQAESSSAASNRRAVIEVDEDSDAEDEDAQAARLLREMSSQDGATSPGLDAEEDAIIETTTASDVDVEANTSFTGSATTPQPRSRPGTADVSPITPASSYHTPEASPPSAGRKRKSEEEDDIDQDLIAFANGTRKKKKVNYNF